MIPELLTATPVLTQFDLNVERAPTPTHIIAWVVITSPQYLTGIVGGKCSVYLPLDHPATLLQLKHLLACSSHHQNTQTWQTLRRRNLNTQSNIFPIT